ncbi:hypothetical protein [Streptomyces aidingensis]|uniref:Uncharacterized protein n=1 Tax=Streptomyces aidingensis TaxID=910347 RepID=A0A1I1Q2Q4_9ACTN|nr:hypothetical protein [Streptomyces aidingensis]SFD14138.1 hypothetical protein SAMN05421773_11097 [Streptomyces aidingensis]
MTHPQQPTPPGQWKPAPPPRKNRWPLIIGLGIFLAFAAFGGILELTGNSDDDTSAGQDTTETPPKDVPDYTVVSKETEGNQRTIIIEVNHTKNLDLIFEDAIADLTDNAGYIVQLNCTTGATEHVDNRLANGWYAIGNIGRATTGLDDGETKFEINDGRSCPAT